MSNIEIKIASIQHLHYAESVVELIENAAKERKTGIAKRSVDYLKQKMIEGKAIIALHENEVAGFCYIESWEHGKYVANSGLIVIEAFRKTGLAKKIKQKILELSKVKFPNAKVFGITTSLAVLKINSDLGYRPVTFSELPKDEAFWNGCASCPNYDILIRTEKKHCLCTGMLLKEKHVGIEEQEPLNKLLTIN